MSAFAVSLRKIAKVWNHPNADRLDLAVCEGLNYQFVVGRDEYKVGDSVIYIPIDSVLPAWLIEKLGLTGKLSGKEKNRVKTVTLRQQISQGLVCKPETVISVHVQPENPDLTPEKIAEKLTPEGLTACLGITKYEQPVIFSKSGNLIHMPADIPVYDIEGADSHPDVIDLLMDQNVYISEKVEGSNLWVACRMEDEAAPWEELAIAYGTRHHEIKPIESMEHEFSKAIKAQKLDVFVRMLAKDIFFGKKVCLRGEFCGPGVQGNICAFKEHRIYLFDILVDGKYVPPQEFVDLCNSSGVLTAPLLAINVSLKNWLAGKTLREASNGLSRIACKSGVLREGVVIKPMLEQQHPEIGRAVIKQRDPVYLSKEAD